LRGGNVLIAIDFDETLTADAELWLHFVRKAKTLGHSVICVTARRDTESNRDIVRAWMWENDIDLFTHYTNLGSKIDYMERIGVKVHIWIDDDPRKCALGH
jgi:hypothetical protein